MADTAMGEASAPGGPEPCDAPSQTLYVNNLAERPRKDELRKCLREVFSQVGTVLDVVLCKAHRLRGQAWVVMATPAQAEEARTLLDGFPLYEKPLCLAFARTTSDVVSKAAGTFTPRPAYDKKERKAATKASIRERKRAREAAAADKPAIAAAPPPRSAPAIAPAPAPAPLGGLGGHGHGGGGLPLLPAAPRPYGGFGHGLVDGPALPHRILFVQNLPAAVERPVLVALFSQLPGFREVRTVESRPGLAFVEYADEGAAAAALAALQGFGVGEEHQPIALSFAKR